MAPLASLADKHLHAPRQIFVQFMSPQIVSGVERVLQETEELEELLSQRLQELPPPGASSGDDDSPTSDLPFPVDLQQRQKVMVLAGHLACRSSDQPGLSCSHPIPHISV